MSKTAIDLPHIFHNKSEAERKCISIIITMGGDSIILNTARLFSTGFIPPIISFTIGTLGWLCKFELNNYSDILIEVFEHTRCDMMN